MTKTTQGFLKFITMALLCFIAGCHNGKQNAETYFVGYNEMDIEKRIEYFKKAIELKPNFRSAHYDLKEAELRKVRFSEICD